MNFAKYQNKSFNCSSTLVATVYWSPDPFVYSDFRIDTDPQKGMRICNTHTWVQQVPQTWGSWSFMGWPGEPESGDGQSDDQVEGGGEDYPAGAPPGAPGPPGGPWHLLLLATHFGVEILLLCRFVVAGSHRCILVSKPHSLSSMIKLKYSPSRDIYSSAPCFTFILPL